MHATHSFSCVVCVVYNRVDQLEELPKQMQDQVLTASLAAACPPSPAKTILYEEYMLMKVELMSQIDQLQSVLSLLCCCVAENMCCANSHLSFFTFLDKNYCRATKKESKA